MSGSEEKSRRKAKDILARLLATTAGTLVVASAVGAAAKAQASTPPTSTLLERADDVGAKLAAAPASERETQPPVQLAYWGNWHNGGYHPWWHNWPNWRNWHNWHNWGNW